MSTKRSLPDELREYNRSLDQRLRGHYGMSLRVFKVVKALTQLAGVAAGIYAMSLGAPPLATFAITAIIISGPEAAEYLINQQ